MANDGATLVRRGSSQPGEQPNGISAQYQVSGVLGSASTAVHGYDSGNIIGHVQPGGAGEKLVQSRIQDATDLICNSLPLGNTLTSTAGVGLIPIVNPAQTEAAGLSLAPQTE